MKTRKFENYPLLTVVELDYWFSENNRNNHTERFVKVGPNSWARIHDTQESVIFSNWSMAHAEQEWAKGNHRVYKPCNHGNVVRVGKAASGSAS